MRVKPECGGEDGEEDIRSRVTAKTDQEDFQHEESEGSETESDVVGWELHREPEDQGDVYGRNLPLEQTEFGRRSRSRLLEMRPRVQE